MIAACQQQTRNLYPQQLLSAENLISRRVTKARHSDVKNERRAHTNVKEADFVSFIRDCAKNKDLCRGARVHADLLKKGLVEKSSCAIVSMYAKCGAPKKAQDLLHDLTNVDVFTWTALITAYAQAGYAQNALFCFEQMQNEGVCPDAVTFASALKACANVGALDKGEQIHDQISKQGLLRNNVVLGTALIDMYAKCGVFDKAVQVLEGLLLRDVVFWNALLAGYVQHGKNDNALHCFEKMQRECFAANAVTCLCVLKACGNIGAVEIGERVHDDVVRQGLLAANVCLGKALVDMYTKCGALTKARCLLEDLPDQDIILWSNLISTYVNQGRGKEALACFDYMERKCLSPDAVSYICISKACGCIGAVNKGDYIYEEVAKRGLLRDNLLLGTALIDMYFKCGAVDKAHQVFDRLPLRDVVTWSALIGGYAQVGQGKDALNCFDLMRYEGFSPNSVTYINVLKACGSAGAIEKGEEVHKQIARQRLLQHHIAIGNAVVDMYVKCQALVKAHQLLEELPFRDVVSWNILIAGYSQQGKGLEALICLEQMEYEGFFPDAVTFTCILKACGSIGAVEKGGEIHDEIARQEFLQEDVVLGTALLNMYAKCGSFSRAREILDRLAVKDVVSWSALLAGYAELGHAEKALNCLTQMQNRGIIPDAAVFSCVLSACIHSGLAEVGQRLFSSIRQTFSSDPDMHHYVQMVDLFGHLGYFDKAAMVIRRMPDMDLLAVWSRFLPTCQEWGNVSIGEWAYEHAIRMEKSDANFNVCRSNMYVTAGLQENSHNLEDLEGKIPSR